MRLCRSLRGAVLAASLVVGWSATAWAQEPPLNVPRPGHLTKPTDVLSVGDWLVYPTVKGFGLWSDNLFQSSTQPVNTTGLGIAPNLIAEWTNGIHSTTLYGNLEKRWYPDHAQFNAFDRAAGFTQRYEPLRDLLLSVQGDYIHKTITGGLISGFPTPASVPTTTQLPNGNTVLPNGNIIDPNGNVVGQTTPALNVAAANNLIVNPFDQFTATASITKLLNRGRVSVSGSLSKTEYESGSSSPDYKSRSLYVNGSHWVVPLFYVYSNAAFGWTDFGAAPATLGQVISPTGVLTTTAAGGSNSSNYRVVGGLGTERIGLMRWSFYFGHQASETSSATSTGSAEGDVWGGRWTYEPTPYWTFNFTVDHTDNFATGGAGSIIAQPLNPTTPVVLSTGTSTRTTSTLLESNYSISKEWSVYTRAGYTRVEFVGSPRRDDAWLADLVLTYQMMRNLSLSWEYQYTSLVSNIPLLSSERNYFMGSATYKF
jgi:hypothetical protein